MRDVTVELKALRLHGKQSINHALCGSAAVRQGFG